MPIYEPAKTVVDCFKYRSRLGLDVALEALRNFHEGADPWTLSGTTPISAACKRSFVPM